MKVWNFRRSLLSALLALSVVGSAKDLINCGFTSAEGFVDNGTNKDPFLLNHDYGNTGANNSIIDDDGNVWRATQGTGLKSYFSQNYAGTLPETYILPGDAFEIIPSSSPAGATQGLLSYRLRLGSSSGNGTTFKVQGWDTDHWDTLHEITNLGSTTVRVVSDHTISDISLYSKYRFIQDGGGSSKKQATLDDFKITYSEPILISTKFDYSEGFDHHSSTKQSFNFNYDYGNTGANNSIIDTLGNVWMSVAGTPGMMTYDKGWIGLDPPECFLDPNSAFEIIVNPTLIPATPQEGLFSFVIKTVSSSNNTTFKLKGWDGSSWYELYTLTTTDESVNTISDHIIPDVSIYSKYMFIQEGGTNAYRSTIDNFEIRYRPLTPQVVDGGTTTQTSKDDLGGYNDVMGLEVLATGSAVPYSLAGLNLELTDSSNVAKLEVYTTGTSSTFDITSATLVYTKLSPGETELITSFSEPTPNLVNGTNYFWFILTPNGSGMGNSSDLACTQFTVDNGAVENIVPDISNPNGDFLFNYLEVVNATFDEGTMLPGGAGNVPTLGSNPTITDGENYTDVNGDTWRGGGGMIWYGNNAYVVTNGNCSVATASGAAGGYIEVTPSEDLSAFIGVGAEIRYAERQRTGADKAWNIEGWSGTAWEVIKSESRDNSSTNNYLSAYVSDVSTYSKFRLIKTNSVYGSAWDNFTILLNKQDMSYNSSACIQQHDTDFAVAGQADVKIIGISIDMLGNSTPYNLTELSLDLQGSSYVSGMTIYSTGNSATFNTSTPVIVVNYPEDEVTLTGLTQQLLGGTNYFWVAYDIKEGTPEGTTFDADCVVLTIDNGVDPILTDTPNPSTPAGEITVIKPLDNNELTTVAPGSWSIAILPDIQYYTETYNSNFTSQVEWIRDNQTAHNIQHVLQLGDLTDNNNATEFERAKTGFDILRSAGVPFTLNVGNHDMGPSGNASTRDSLFDTYFDYATYSQGSHFGGVMTANSLRNSYYLFTAGGKAWIVISLEWAPTDEMITWADGVMQAHPDRYGILITHAYMNYNNQRYDQNSDYPQAHNPHNYSTPGPVNDGEELWNKLVKKHKFVFTFNGHVLGDGTGYKKSITQKGNACHQVLTNYQMRSAGGEGYLKIVEFDNDGKTVRLKAYSPVTDTYLTDADQSFSVEISEPVTLDPQLGDNESFEDGETGVWLQDSNDQLQFLNHEGQTPTPETGPSDAFSGQKYLYLDTTGGISGDFGSISQWFNLVEFDLARLDLSYHMFGSDVGYLAVSVSADDENWTELTRVTGDQGDEWKEMTVDLSTYAGGAIKIKITAAIGQSVTRSSLLADIAIDSIELSDPTPTPVLDLVAYVQEKQLIWTVVAEDGVEKYVVQVFVDDKWGTFAEVLANSEKGGIYMLDVDNPELSYRIIVVDESGFRQTFGVETDKLALDLVKGWNLLSSPFDSLAGNNDFAYQKWAWNGENYYISNDIPAKNGFWVYSDSNKTVFVDGNTCSDSDISLSTGWNLVGPVDNMKIPDSTIIYTWDSIYRDLLEEGNYMIKGRGYWIFSIGKGVLSLSK